MNEINQERIDKGKKDVQKLLKDIFETYDTIEKLNLDRIKYKKSIYDSKKRLENEVDNYGYSALLGCMLDIEEEFINISNFIEDKLNKIDTLKKQYVVIEENEMEEEER